jgi:hypothetical protein
MIALILLALSTNSFAAGKKPPAPEPSPTVIATPIPMVTPHIGLRCVTCRPEEKVKVAAAEIQANETVQGQCFQDFMLKWGLIWTNEKTPAQVVGHIKRSNLTVPVHYYMGDCSTVGYRNVGAPDIYFNRCIHKSYGVCDTASNATHEWSHVLGYGHSVKATPTRGRTVPYAINHAFKACCVGAKGMFNELQTR